MLEDERILSWGLRYLGVFLLSASTLMLQVAYTRIFSIALWYHFIWMIVSISLLGYAASGTLLSVLPAMLKVDLDRMLTITSALFSLSSLLCYEVSNHIPFDPSRISWDGFQLIYITAYYLLLSIPFLLSGLTIVLAIDKAENRINRLYFSNLLGSAIGSVFVLMLFKPLTGPGVMVFTSFISGASALIFGLKRKDRGRYTILGWMIVLLVLTHYAGDLFPIRMSPYKNLIVALKYPDSQLIETRWGSFSRVDVVESGLVRSAPGLSLQYEALLPDQLGIIVDGDALSAITNYDKTTSSLNFTKFLPSALPYRLLKEPRVLIIDAEGGLGVLVAIHHNSSFITAVEKNPIIVELVQKRFDTFAGSIYTRAHDQRVNVVVNGGRNFIRNSLEEYDVIELSMTYGASASSTGIYSLSENYLYTVESFKEFIGHLSEKGVLSVSRWLLPPPREDVRIVSLAVSALESSGVPYPKDHIAVIRSWGTLTMLVGKSPLDFREIADIKNFCEEMGFDIIYLPGVKASEVNRFNRFSEPIYYRIVSGIVNSDERKNFFKTYLYEVRPTTDEKPFFFHFFKWNRLFETYKSLGNKWQPLIEGGFLVPLSLIQAFFLSILFILLPLRKLKNVDIEKNWSHFAYFFCLGFGYMLIEIATIQRFILILGHPTFSVSIVIFNILITSGIGSYLSGRLKPGSKEHKLILLSIGLLVLLYSMASPFLRSILGLPITSRLIISSIIISPLGFLMGIPFPLGVRMLNQYKRTLIPWAWAANGSASVLGSIFPSVIALFYGFTKVFYVAGAAYILSLLIIIYSSSRVSSGQ